MRVIEETQVSRLQQAIHWSRQRMEPFLRERREAVKEYVGHHYSDNGSNTDIPVNMIELLLHTPLVNLSSGEPTVQVTTRRPSLRMQAQTRELAVQNMIKVAKLRDSLADVTLEALVGLGVSKVGMALRGIEDASDLRRGIGRPYNDRIDPDDLILDMNARDWDYQMFVGHRYRVPYDWAVANQNFRDDARSAIRRITDYDNTPEGSTRTSSISSAGDAMRSSYIDEVELEDIFLPTENVLLTKAVGANDFLQAVEWDGPMGGPFKRLVFHRVPGQILPLSPVANLRALNSLMNEVFNKIADQATRQKDIVLARMGGGEDSKRIIDAEDGQVVGCDDPRNAQQFSFGGANNVNVAIFTLCKMLFPYMAGNMDAYGGLAAQADTLGQDQLLTANASRKIQGMQNQVLEYVRSVIRDFAWYAEYDPFYNPELVRKIPNTNIEVPVSFAFEDRAGDFLDFNFDIQPASIAPMPPSARASQIVQVLNVLGPYMPLAMAQGVTVNIAQLVHTLGKLTGVNEIADIIMSTAPIIDPSMQPQGMPAQTKRTYERVNRPGASRQGQDETMMQAMLGGNPQNAEKAGLARSVA